MSVESDAKKQRVAQAALAHLLASGLEPGAIIGVGTGSTVNFFIDVLASVHERIGAAVSSSNATTARLQAIGIKVLDLNDVEGLQFYVDGADEATRSRHLIKGGGAALTREKIVTSAASRFICIVDDGKVVNRLGKFPLPIEVIPMARALVARGGRPGLALREGLLEQLLEAHRNCRLLLLDARLAAADAAERQLRVAAADEPRGDQHAGAEAELRHPPEADDAVDREAAEQYLAASNGSVSRALETTDGSPVHE